MSTGDIGVVEASLKPLSAIRHSAVILRRISRDECDTDASFSAKSKHCVINIVMALIDGSAFVLGAGVKVRM